jgi:GntR family transcriptional repressor for pyruvate dehydrogenase complex
MHINLQIELTRTCYYAKSVFVARPTTGYDDAGRPVSMATMDDELQRLREFVEQAGEAGEAKLPPEPKLSDALGISRGRLRTMLKRLEDEGLIWRHVGKGTFVGERQLTVDDQDWSASISADDLMDARILLEPQLAAQAAIHATPADIAELNQCLLDMSTAASFAQWRRLDERLHRTIAKATHNALLLMLYDTLRSQAQLSLNGRMEEIFGSEGGPRRATGEEHHAFVESIRQHNPHRSEELMRQHLQSVRQRLFGLR